MPYDDLIREALAAERAAAYAQLDPAEYEELIAATDAALEARPSLSARSEEALAQGIHDEMTFVSTPESRMDVARDWARELIASDVVQVAEVAAEQAVAAIIQGNAQ